MRELTDRHKFEIEQLKNEHRDRIQVLDDENNALQSKTKKQDKKIEDLELKFDLLKKAKEDSEDSEQRLKK